MRVGDLVMLREDLRRPQDENSIGLVYENCDGSRMILWNDEEEPEELDNYLGGYDLEVVSESR